MVSYGMCACSIMELWISISILYYCNELIYEKFTLYFAIVIDGFLGIVNESLTLQMLTTSLTNQEE